MYSVTRYRYCRRHGECASFLPRCSPGSGPARSPACPPGPGLERTEVRHALVASPAPSSVIGCSARQLVHAVTEDALTALGELKEREADRWPAFLAMLGDLSDAGLQHLVQECFADAQAGRRECRAVLTDGRACRQLADHYRREIPLCTRHASRDAGTIVQEAGAIVWQLTADDRQLHNAGASNEPTVSLRQLRDLHAALTRLLATLDGVEPRTVAEQQHHNRMAQVRKTQKVYFARSRLGGDLIKIGIAVNVGRRMAALHAEAIAVVETKNAERLEKLLHARLAPFRTVGEWFEPSPQVLREVERFAGAA